MGRADGYSAALYRAPEQHLTVVVLSNDDDAPVEKVGRDLMARFLAQRFGSDELGFHR